MIVNPDVVGENTPKNTKKQQLTENEKNINYQNVSWRGPVFKFILPGGAARPLAPVSYAADPAPD